MIFQWVRWVTHYSPSTTCFWCFLEPSECHINFHSFTMRCSNTIDTFQSLTCWKHCELIGKHLEWWDNNKPCSVCCLDTLFMMVQYKLDGLNLSKLLSTLWVPMQVVRKREELLKLGLSLQKLRKLLDDKPSSQTIV